MASRSLYIPVILGTSRKGRMSAHVGRLLAVEVAKQAGVELFSVLITRKLLIPGTATTAKKAPLPDPLYVYCTKLFFALEPNRHHTATTVSHRSSGMDRKST